MKPESPAERLRRMRNDPRWRQLAGESARRAVEDAAADEGELEDKLKEAATSMQPESNGLPLKFRDERGHVHLPGGDLVPANSSEVQNYAQAPVRTCGTCKHFNLKGGQREMVRQRFGERLVLEEEWKLHHMGAPLDHYGVCDASGGQMATSTVAKADDCPGYKPRSRLFR